MRVGDSASTVRAFTRADVDDLIALGGPSAGPGLVPEPLIGALFSYLLGVELPGFGTNYLKQDTRYLIPAPLDQPLRAHVTVTRLRPDKQLIDLHTVCHDAQGRLIAEGRALVFGGDVVSGSSTPEHGPR